jgi:hypothetical protein
VHAPDGRLTLGQSAIGRHVPLPAGVSARVVAIVAAAAGPSVVLIANLREEDRDAAV